LIRSSGIPFDNAFLRDQVAWRARGNVPIPVGQAIATAQIAAPGSAKHFNRRRAFDWRSIAQQSISPPAILDGGIRPDKARNRQTNERMPFQRNNVLLKLMAKNAVRSDILNSCFASPASTLQHIAVFDPPE
jgi:hypothetical protein